MRRAQQIAVGSVVLGLIVLALKGAAWWITGSAALYSDALETVVNVLAGCVAVGALHFAAQPADDNHPYGHDKAEFFAAVIEGALIIAAALQILQHAWATWEVRRALDLPLRGLALNAAGTALNAVWAALLMRAGARERSPTLSADGRHLLTDVVSGIGIVAGLALQLATGLTRLDPLIAAAVAVYILWTGLRLMRDSVSGLMDQAPPPAVVARIRALVSENAQGAIEAHDLRTRHAGRITFLDFHLVVPGDMRVAESHAICDRIEARLRSEMEGLVVTIHVEPEDKAKRRGVPVV